MKRNIWLSSSDFIIQYDVLRNLKPSERLLVKWENGSIELLDSQEKFKDNQSQSRNQIVVAFMIVDISAAKNL